MARQFTSADAGCWFDSARGIYIGEAVIEKAIEYGYDPKEVEPEGGWKEHEHYCELWDEAENFLSELAPDGYWVGATENGDFGMWEVDEENVEDCYGGDN